MRRPRLSYANVVATLALFIALGGTSYAALKLPRDSVGSAQIRSQAVNTSDIRNGSVLLTDLATSAKKSLRGQQGSTGPPGAAGQPAVSYAAAVGSAGQFLRGNASSGGHTSGGSGSYTIGFATNVSSCVYTATLGSTDSVSQPAGYVIVRDDAGKVGVQIYDTAGNPADRPFHLIVAC